MLKEFENPYHLVLKHLNRNRVDYLIIGVSGINYYAGGPLQFLSTADFDLFIRPEQENIKRALLAVFQSGFKIGYKDRLGKMRLIRRVSKTLCAKLSCYKTVVVAEGPYKTLVELVQKVSGFSFDEMKKNAVFMKDTKLKITFPVGRLQDLIESKKKAGRAKDLLFLAKYKTLFLNNPQ